MNRPTVLTLLILALLVLMSAFAAAQTPAEPLPLPPDPVLAAQISDSARGALLGAWAASRSGEPVPEETRVRAGDISVRDGWAFGLLTVRVPDGLHAEPDIRLFLSRYDAGRGGWQTLLEGSPEFQAALSVIPTGVMPEAARSMLAQPASVTRAGANLGLPYAMGETWTLTGGPHPNGAGTNSRPWSAVDMAFPGTAAGRIRAADGGIAWVPSDCPNLIRIDHPGGWRTGYYHVINIRIGNGQLVQRGQWVADEGAATGCGGFATGPHVHFSLRRYDSTSFVYPDSQTFVNIAGSVFGGWEVRDGSSPYQGCMRRTRDGFTVCAGNGQVYYEPVGGATPTPYPNSTATPIGMTPTPLGPQFDRRMDYNRDGYADLWMVNWRPIDGSDTQVWIYDGRNPTRVGHFKQTTLPPQPVELNTSFAAGDYNNDGRPDLWVFHRRMDTSNTTALRVIDLRSEVLYDLLADTPTVLPPLDDTARFAVADYNRDGKLDIYAFIPDRVTRKTMLRIVNGANFGALLAEVQTGFAAPSSYNDIHFAVADYNNDGVPDVWRITPRGGAFGQPVVTVIDGTDFLTTLSNAELPMPSTHTGLNAVGFMVGDYNRDAMPDVWRVDRRTGALMVVSGANWTTVLYNGESGVVMANQPNWQMLGSDRARERIPAQVPVLVSPPDGALVTDPTVSFRPGGLANAHVVRFYDITGTPLKLVRQKAPVWPAWCGRECTVDLRAYGLALRDGQIVFWDVQAQNPFGKARSLRYSFTMDLPGPVTLIDPLDAAVTGPAPVFMWQTVPTAVRYVLLIRDMSNTLVGKQVVPAHACTAGICSAMPPLPLTDGAYTWQVRSVDAYRGKSLSQVVAFVVQNPLPMP